MTIEARLHVERGAFTLDVDLTMPSTGVTAIFGRSGAGKTTLLRAVAGLEGRDDGYLSIAGQVWQDGGSTLPVHQRQLGYVFQEPSLFSHLSVERNLDYGRRRVPPAERKIPRHDVLAWLGVEPLLGRHVDDLSGGERQRVAVARALLASPRLLLMDEPLASLDRESKTAILPLLGRVVAELDIPVLYVSHSLDEVARLADHLVWLDQGRVVESGPVASLLTRIDSPLASGPEAEALIEATVAGRSAADHLLELDFPGGRFLIPGAAREPGATVRLRLLARDVSLTLERQEGTSILNIFPVRVTSLAADGEAQMMVRLDAGGVPILARVTRRSVDALGLEDGAEVWAQVKSVAVLN